MTPPQDPTPSVDPLDALIASYVQAIEAGQVPNRRDLLDRNPGHSAALQTFFADFDRMDRVAAPLRMAGDLDETGALEANPQSAPPTLRYFGDYELLEEVARGGMGIVYKARQTSLNRLVALKMILAGTFATPREVARFQAEAEAAANLDHPQIVPVYEVGEHEGQQYFSMKFVEGGSLATHPRADPKAEVLGLITIARAVHHAHQHGVLHRDLKPSNVLVDPRGDRFVTDFGLAKRLTDIDRSLTDPGQILGTPRYMSPEQAAGRKDLTVAADIYALGVILYERLTGQTPFDGETPLALLRQVRETTPPRPSSIRPGLDRDLETIVLKCLEKDPTHRYPDAADLAEDLTRWLEGRPISARPVGQVERFWRLCRRNPAITGLAASVALALLLGAGISGRFAYQERKARIRAEKAEDETERSFARSLARPLNPEAQDKPILSEPEIEALWELASQGTESLRVRFLEEATREPLTLRQLSARSEPALIAALGLDPDRRARAARLLVERLHQPGLPPAARVELAFLLLELEDEPSPRTEEATKIIIQALDDELAPNVRKFINAKIIGSCDSISRSCAATLLVAALGREADDSARSRLARAMATLSGRLDPVDAVAIARSIAEVIGRADYLARSGFATDLSYRSNLAEALATLSGRLDPAGATTIARSIAEAIARETDGDAQSNLAKALARLSERLEPVEAMVLCGRAALSIVEAIGRETDGSARDSMVKGLASLSGRLAPAEAATIARSIAEDIAREAANHIRSDLAEALATLSGHLEPAEAAALCGRAARSIAEAIGHEKDGDTRPYLVRALASLTGRLTQTEATTIARSIAEAIAHNADNDTRSDLAEALATLSGRLDPADAATIARSIVEAIGRETSDGTRSSLAGALATLSGRLGPADASAIAQSIAEAIGRETGDWVRIHLAEALASLSGRLAPAEAAIIARSIIEAIGRETVDRARSNLAEALASLSGRLTPAEAATIARSIAEEVGRQADSKARSGLARALTSLSGRLGPADASAIAQSIAEAIGRVTNGHAFRLAEALVSLSGRLEAAEATALCSHAARSIAEAIGRQTDRDAQYGFAVALATLSGRLGPAEATALCDHAARSIAEAIGRETDKDARYRLTIALTSLSVRLDPAEAATLCGRAALSIAEAMNDDTDEKSRSGLVKALARLLVRVESAAIVRSIATRFLSRSMAAGTARSLFSPFATPRRDERAVRFAATVLQLGLGGTLIATIREASEPYPCRLNSQDLVELLKMPTCFGETRRVVLDQLENIHGRRFTNHWAFVRFAREKGLNLDFTSPPRRHDPRASLDDSTSGSIRSSSMP